MFAKLSKKGQITLPAEVRKVLNLRYGARVRFVIKEDGVRIIPGDPGIESLQGTVNVPAPQDFKAARRRVMEERTREESTRT